MANKTVLMATFQKYDFCESYWRDIQCTYLINLLNHNGDGNINELPKYM